MQHDPDRQHIIDKPPPVAGDDRQPPVRAAAAMAGPAVAATIPHDVVRHIHPWQLTSRMRQLLPSLRVIVDVGNRVRR